MNVSGTRAHIHNTLKTCEALQAAGADVLFVHPASVPKDLDDVLARHRIATRFKMEFVDGIAEGDLVQPNVLKRLTSHIKAYGALIKYLMANVKSIDVVYYRHHLISPVAVFFRIWARKPVVFESHYVYIRKMFSQLATRFSIHSANGVVTITDALKKFYRLTSDLSLVVPCHAAEPELVPDEQVENLRRELSLPQDKKILCYTGTLGSTIQGISYEVETMVEILRDLPTDFVSLIVGAKDNDAYLLQAADKAGVQDRLIVRPWCDRETVFKYLAASDYLLMPRVGTAPGSSPSKMFDYLAMKKPIIAASTPPVDEVLKNRINAILVDADRQKEWGEAVKLLESDGALREGIAERSWLDSLEYSWSRRGQRIKWFAERAVSKTKSFGIKKSLKSWLEYGTGLLGWAYVKTFGTKSGVVLAFHSISESPWIHAVTPELFDEHIRCLESDVQIVPLSRLQKECLNGKPKRMRKPLVAITFDDGYRDWVHAAAPVLSKHKTVATFFVTTSFKLVTTQVQEGIAVISPEGVNDLAAAGHEIGSHGHTHVDLSGCDKDAFSFEVSESRRILRELTGQGIIRLSYPKGRYATQHFPILEANGYEMALAGHGVIGVDSEKFAAPRLPVYGNWSARKLRRRFYAAMIGFLV